MIKGLPDTLEICARDMDGYPCCGTIFRRLAPNFPYCRTCGSKEPGITYARVTATTLDVMRGCGDHVYQNEACPHCTNNSAVVDGCLRVLAASPPDRRPCSGGWCGADLARGRGHTPECAARVTRDSTVYRGGEPRGPAAAPCCGCTCQKCASGHDTGEDGWGEHTDACQELRNAGRKD